MHDIQVNSELFLRGWQCHWGGLGVLVPHRPFAEHGLDLGRPPAPICLHFWTDASWSKKVYRGSHWLCVIYMYFGWY